MNDGNKLLSAKFTVARAVVGWIVALFWLEEIYYEQAPVFYF
jgi:hypothetical protein